MARRGPAGAWRWAVVAAVLAALAALPSVVAALPAADGDTDAAALRQQVLDSAGVAFSGYAISTGGLTLPVSDTLTPVADLLSDQTTMRAWYRGTEDWRVDVVTPTGETGTHRDDAGTWTWEYADQAATRGDDVDLALPTAPDLLPSALGRRLLSEAADDEVTRTAPARVAGRDALGLRYTPADDAAAVTAVDLWVEPDTGLALRVVVRSADTATPALDTRFLDLSTEAPDAATTSFTPPAGADVRRAPDLAELVAGRDDDDRRVRLPGSLAGLDPRGVEGVPESVGVYGSGITVLAVSLLPRRAAEGLRTQLAASPDAVVDELGVRIAAGPLGLMVVDVPRGPDWLLAGTVTTDALAAAAAELPRTGGRA